MFKLKIYKFGFFLALRFWYHNWSRLYRWLFEGKYKSVQLKNYKNIQEIADFTKNLKWQADGWKQLWDAISLPQRVQYIGDNKLVESAVDCDEFAIYIVNAIESSKANKTWEQNYYTPQFLSIGWLDANGKYKGHNVCLLKRFSQGMVDPVYEYMDYGLPTGSALSISDLVVNVIQRFDPKGIPVGYAIHDKDLNVLEVTLS